MSENLKIFIGFSEIANFVNSYRKGFEALGHTTFTVVGYRNKYYPNAKYDVVLSERNGLPLLDKGLLGRIYRSLQARLKVALVFFKALFICDVFYYNTGGNVLPFRLDYALIKLFRKKLAVIYLGSEIRHWYLYKKELEAIGFDELFATCIEAYRKQNFGTYAEKRERVQAAEAYADIILSQPGFAQLQTLPYLRATVGLYLPDYGFAVHGRKRPLLVHAPSARGVKGTEFVEEALERLKQEGIEFDFKLIENMPNQELIKLLVEADIVIDELNSDTIGVLSTEAMATGNAVLTGYMAELVKVPQPCPVMNTNRLNVYDHIKELILNVELRTELAQSGRQYVEKHHDINKIAAKELNWMFTPVKERMYDFVPTFDANTPIPEAVLAEEKDNR